MNVGSYHRIFAMARSNAMNPFGVPSLIEAKLSGLRHPVTILVAALGAAGLCGWFVDARAYVPFAILLTVLGLGLLWPFVSLIGLSGKLSFDMPRGAEGETVVVRLTLRNRSPLGAYGVSFLGQFFHPDEEDGLRPRMSVVWIGGWRSVEAEWTFQPSCRGVYPQLLTVNSIQNIRCFVTTGYPFGIISPRRSIAVDTELLVAPRVVNVSLTSESVSFSPIAGAVMCQRAGNVSEVLGFRAYRNGDPLRRISWRHTAKLDRFIVAEQQDGVSFPLQFILDCDPQIHEGIGPQSSFEWAIRIVGSLADEGLHEGRQVVVQVGEERFVGNGGERDRDRFRDFLARLPWLGESATASPCNVAKSFLITTDKRTKLMPANAQWTPDQLILLQASAFRSIPAEPTSAPVDCCLWISGPNDFAPNPGRVSREVTRAC